MTFDFDDFHEANHKLDRLWALKKLNPLFRCTVFAVPALGSHAFWESVPRWIELAVHGWLHPHPYECAHWDTNRMRELMDSEIVRRHFVNGFKAPGWQISDACYEALLEREWWVADQHLEDERRPLGLRTYLYEDGGWHGHIQDWGSNGIDETWHALCAAVEHETEFRFASEAARLHPHPLDPGEGVDAGGVRALGSRADDGALGASDPHRRGAAGLLMVYEPSRGRSAR